MVLINYAGREINAKIVYYGPGLSGKTTNLECIYASVPATSRGKMVSMKTRQDRTLFFDFLPLELGEVHGFRTRFLLYTVPGQVFYNATRKLVLKGVDAVVFVADSTVGKLEDNLDSRHNLEENLRELGLSLDSMPWVVQYNKRDLPQVHTVEELENAVNPRRVPSFEAAAASGIGVYETLHAVSRLLFQRLVSELRPGAPRGAVAEAAAAAIGPRAAQALEPRPMPGPQPPPNQARPAVGAPTGAAPVWPGERAGTNPRPQPLASSAAAPPAAPVTAVGEPEPVAGPPRPRTFTAGPAATEPTPAQILDSVHAASQALDAEGAGEVAPGARDEYGAYGHLVDLSLEMGQAASQVPSGGFIKDPLRRADKAAGGLGALPSPGETPVRTQHVTVAVTRAEIEKGGVIRILLDLRVVP